MALVHTYCGVFTLLLICITFIRPVRGIVQEGLQNPDISLK